MPSTRRRGLYALRNYKLKQKKVVSAPVKKYVKNTIKRNLRDDMHNCFVQSTGYVTTSTPVVSHLSSVSQGDTASSRDGNAIKAVTSLDLNYQLVANTQAAVPQECRIIVFQDKMQVADTNPSATDLFGTSTPTSYEMYTWDNKVSKRFSILYDRVHSGLWGYNGDGSGNTRLQRKLHLKIPNKRIIYNGANSTDINKNGIYIMTVCSTEATYGPTLAFQSRFGFEA